MNKEFIYKIVRYGEKQNYSKMKELIVNTSGKIILEAIKYSIKTDGGVNFWNYLLKGFALCSNVESCNKRRFECVEMFLHELGLIELPYKRTYDLITRLCSELICFQNHQLLTIVDICYESIRYGKPHLVWWKDIFPEALALLSNQTDLDVNGVKMSGLEYKNHMMKSLFSMKWNLQILSSLASMFVELKLDDNNINSVLVKFCKHLLQLNPVELPSLAYQLFCLCQTASQLIIPILGLEKYFHRFYYKKLFIDLDSESSCFDSIELFSERDLREAEETILHHLSFCTRFRIREEQIYAILRNLISSPQIVLTPFFLSAVISMSQANRDPDCWILSSPLLIFLRNTINNNEEQIELSKRSVWCEDTFQTRWKNMEQIFTILIDQNKEGKDIITPGLVNLAFVLLKYKNCPRLNLLSITFLSQFIKKRFVFGYGIVKILADWMIAEQEAEQYSECLTVLSHSDTFTFSESFKTIKNVLDFFLWIPGRNAMRMISFILPAIKISQPVRDAFIDIMKKAINSKDHESFHLGVYGFCCLLKLLNNNNSQRSNVSGTSLMCTQQCISGYSLMSQTNLNNRSNSQRHFNVLVLEIIGCLRKCFSASLEIKETLYENLCRAVLLNPKLAPHFLEFIDNHFRGYFKVDESETIIFFDKIVYQENNIDIVKVCDNIGQLTLLVSSIILVCEKNEIIHNSDVIKTIIKTAVERIISKDYKLIDDVNCFRSIEFHIALQQLNFLEALMYYLLWTSKTMNNNIIQIHELFEEHQKIKKLIENSIKNKKVKSCSDKTEKVQNILISKKISKNSTIRNIWDLLTLERFLKLLFDDVVPFANSASAARLKNNLQFVRYILGITAECLKELQLQPDYKQVKLSIRLFKQICFVSRIIYERCIKTLPKMWQNFDSKSAYLSSECLKQSFLTIQKYYDKKFDQYLKEVDLLINSDDSQKIHQVLQNVFVEAVKETEGENCDQQIPTVVLQCLEVLYNFIPAGSPLVIQCFDWLYDFCQKCEVHKEISLIYKLLFTMRLKTRSGMFFETIAFHLGKVMGVISEEKRCVPQFDFKALTDTSSDSCYLYLINSLRKQLDDVDFFICKVKSSFYNLKFVFDDDQEICNVNLKTMEGSICTQFTHIANSLIQMSNIDTPLGECMDNLIRVLIQFYISLNNMTKHIMLRHSSLPISFLSIKYDQVVRLAGKPLASRIYALIINIDEKIIYSMDKNKKANPTADRAKVLKETKYIPKLILRIENFNKHVMFLSKKTGNDLTEFLHIGTVRDFRIQTKNLREAIDYNLEHSNQIEELSDQNNDDNEEMNSNDDKISYNDDTNENRNDVNISKTIVHKLSKQNKKTERKKSSCVSLKKDKSLNESLSPNDVAMIDTPAMGFLNEQESDENAGLQFLQNVVKISEKGRKRKNANGNEDSKPQKRKKKNCLRKK